MKLLNRELPNAPSYLLQAALGDLALCEADPKYEIDMTQWHYPGKDGVCSVCLAGSVIAQSGVPPEKYVNVWESLDVYDESQKLIALDHFRCGRIIAGLTVMRRNFDIAKMSAETFRLIDDRSITPYAVDRVVFHEQMSQMVNDLRKMGL